MSANRPVDAATCSDRQWWNESGMCGCGDENCHPGRACGTITDDGWLGHTVCSRCTMRHDQGFHERGRCQCEPSTPVVPPVESLPLFMGPCQCCYDMNDTDCDCFHDHGGAA